MRTFVIVWIGQFVSLLGSKLSEFALAIWAYQKIDSFTHVAILAVLMFLPNILVSPLTGALVDRWNRRWSMILSDAGSGLCSLITLTLVLTNQLQLWHIYVGVPILSVCGAFQTPAYAAAITQLVPTKHQGRANGLADLPQSVAKIITPLMAAFLIGIIQLKGILLIDSITFVLALIALVSVRFPPVARTTPRKRVSLRTIKPLLKEFLGSWHYIRANPNLFSLWGFIIATYFTIGMFDISFWLLVLKFGSATQFGIVITAAGCGMLLGSAVMSLWGGPKRRVLGILTLTLLQGIVIIALGLSVKLSLVVASIGAFMYLFADPIIMGSNRAIWQRQVPIPLQGRVFALQLMLQRGALIPAYLVAGLLVDHLFEALLATHPFFRSSLGLILGTGPGAGTCLFLVILGFAKILLSLVAYRNPYLRKIET